MTGPGADDGDDADLLAPLETLVQGSADTPRRHGWLMVVGAVAVAVITVWAVTSGAAQTSRPSPDPLPSASSQPATLPQVAPLPALPLTDGRPYVRADVATRSAVVVVPLTNTDVAPITLTGVELSGGAPEVSAELMTMAGASPLILSESPPTGLLDTSAPGPLPAPIRLEQGLSAALVLVVSPDCGSAASAVTPTVTVHGTTAAAAAPAAADFVWLPVVDSSSPSSTWLTDADDAACHPGVQAPAAAVSVTHVVDGLRVTTTGPTHLPGSTLFVVTLTATSTTSTMFHGTIGVMAAARVKGNGFSSFVMPDQIDTRPDLVAAGIGGPVVRGVTRVATGAELRHQSLAAGATMTTRFYLDATSAPDIVGAVRGWVPVVERDGRPAVMADPGGYPVLTLPH